MQALVYNEMLEFVADYPAPEPGPGESRIRVVEAGICGTDLEILAGYAGFKGILGHEFAGVVDISDDWNLLGKRVVGEINVGCGICPRCLSGMEKHCADRKVLGIRGLDGCMADFCVLPNKNLHVIPDAISDRRAVFVEPLSAACEILQHVVHRRDAKAVVLGDGRLGILCAWVLCTALTDVTLLGRRHEKLELAKWRGLKTGLNPFSARSKTGAHTQDADIVVDATGSPDGIRQAMMLCRPKGVIVLKTTVTGSKGCDPTPVVIHEQTIVGSRCGSFQNGLDMLMNHPDMPVERLVTKTSRLEDAVEAFQCARRPESLKIVIKIQNSKRRVKNG